MITTIELEDRIVELDDETIFTVPVAQLPDLKARIAKLNKRAAKLGCEPIVLTFGDIVQAVKLRAVHDGDRWTERREKVPCVLVTVAGSPPKYDGWTFLGTVQLIDGENIVRSVPGASIPVEYRAATDWCDHCRSNRGRKDVFIVRHDSGETKVIGRNCLRDFLGHESPEALVWRATILASLRDAIGEYERLPGANLRDLPRAIDAVFAAAACAIRHFGFHKSQAEDPTKRVADDILYPPRRTTDKYGNPVDWRAGHPVPPRPEAGDEETAEAALAWALAIDRETENDYLYNVHALAVNGTVDPKSMGIACAAVYSYLREQGQVEERKRQAAVSKHVGVVGKRAEFDLTVIKVTTFEGTYGYTHLHLMQDADGNVFKWAASGTMLEHGHLYRLKGTVKKHDVYKDVCQTVLTRCAIIERGGWQAGDTTRA